jgi:HlyD family secretion protein
MMKNRIKVITAAIIIVALASTLGTYLLNRYRKGAALKVSGNIEGDDVRISFRVGQQQIEELLVDEGYVIKTGQLLARLNTEELVKIRDEQAAYLKAAEAQYALDKLDYVRAENLLVAGAISVQKRDMAKTKADTSKADVDKYKASLALAETRLGYANLISPLNGYILVKSALAGETVQVGEPVFTAVDLNNVWVTAYVNETDLGRVKFNQDAYITTDTYPGKRYKGRVSFISDQAEFTPKFIQTQEERVKLVYRIKVRADNESLDLKPGMPADAYLIER